MTKELTEPEIARLLLKETLYHKLVAALFIGLGNRVTSGRFQGRKELQVTASSMEDIISRPPERLTLLSGIGKKSADAIYQKLAPLRGQQSRSSD